MSRRKKEMLVTQYHSQSAIAEAYRAIRTTLKYAAAESGKTAFLFTSSIAGEGKTTIVANLGIMAANDEKNVLLIDCDLRRPNLHHLFGISNRTGLSSVLTGLSGTEEALRDTGIPHLTLLPSGPIQPNPAELLGSARFESLLEWARTRYDFIFIDSPPLLSVADANIIEPCADGIVLVARSMYTKKEQFDKTLKRLERAREKVLGIVLNDKNEAL